MPKSTNLTPLELEIMKVLWDRGPSSVQSVADVLPGDRLAYTTVQTMLNVLLRKGKVSRTLKDRAYIYRPALGRGEAARQAIGDLVDRMFGGSAESLVMGLLESKRISADKLRELEALAREAKPASRAKKESAR